MSALNDGGPAFPHTRVHADTSGTVKDGMTLRDYLAAKAMQAFLSGHIAHHGHESHWPYDQMASEAWNVADAMLKAREVQP